MLPKPEGLAPKAFDAPSNEDGALVVVPNADFCPNVLFDVELSRDPSEKADAGIAPNGDAPNALDDLPNDDIPPKADPEVPDDALCPPADPNALPPPAVEFVSTPWPQGK